MRGRQEVNRLRRRLDETFRRVNELEDALELRSDFARYLCVLVAGYVENAVVELVLAYCSRRAGPEIQKFVERTLERFTNVHRERLLQLLSSFDPDWRKVTEEFIDDERESALNSLIAVRHQIAHGGSAGISYVRVKEYYDSIQEVIEFLTDLLDP